MESTLAHKRTQPSTPTEKHTDRKEEHTSLMALPTATRKWFSKNGPEGFLKIVDAPPHEEPEKIAPIIDLEEITEGTI